MANELADELAIRKLLAEYCHAFDDGRAGDFGALFAEDATFTVFDETRQGRDEIREIVGLLPPESPPGQHVTYNTVIELDGGTAQAWTDFCYLRKEEDGLTAATAGRYHDRFVRDPDRWRFQARTIHFLGGEPPEL